jgi:hypothetical protein
MTGEIPFYGMTGNQLWERLSLSIREWSERSGIPLELGDAGNAWTGVSYPGRGRVLQVRVNANSLRCYPYGVEPSDEYQALDHEPSKCSKSWKKRFPSMFTIETPEQLKIANELVQQVVAKVATEEPAPPTVTQVRSPPPSSPPMLVVTGSY